MNRSALLLLATLALAPATAGCFFFGGGETGPGAGGAAASTDQDIAQYEELQKKLEATRSVFNDHGATELNGIGTRLLWLEFPGFDPNLHSFDAVSSQQIDYGFSIGTGNDYNYRASEDLVVTAEPTGGSVILHAYAIGKSSSSAGELTLPAPSDGTKWWAYAPDHKDVYYVTTGSGTGVWRWTAGSTSPVHLFDLEDLGVTVGEFQDFGVDSGKMVFIESGRIWSLDLASKNATWLGNKTESTSAFLGNDGVLFSTAEGPFFYDYQQASLRDVAAAIAKSSFKLNATFASAHLFNTDLARYRRTVGYIGQSGLFTFDLDSSAVTPLLLNARDNSTVYRYPVFLDDGSVFVQALESNDGAIGADGPVYRLNVKL